jgi:hypothetical protein
MSTLGKILAFLNVLGAVGLVALASMDYGKRKQWGYALYVADLRVKGLPLDEQQVDGRGRPLFRGIGEQTKKELFAGQSPVATQDAEVKRVQQKLQQFIQDAPNNKQQCSRLAQVLLPLARTYSQRERLTAYQKYLADDKKTADLKRQFSEAYRQARQPEPRGKKQRPFEQKFLEALHEQRADLAGPFATAFLQARRATGQPDPAQFPEQLFEQSIESQRVALQAEFDELFTEALSGKRVEPSGNTQNLTAEERRAVIARLLLNLPGVGGDDPAQSPDYTRAITVVGLQAAVNEVNDQAQVLARMTSEVEAEQDRELIAFQLAHGGLIDELRQRAAEVAAANDTLRRTQDHLGQEDALVKKRERDVKDYRIAIDDARQETAKRLKELQTMSQSLYNEQVKLRDATGKNQELLQTIRKLEENR